MRESIIRQQRTFCVINDIKEESGNNKSKSRLSKFYGNYCKCGFCKNPYHYKYIF